jgi:hypothetical protein
MHRLGYPAAHHEGPQARLPIGMHGKEGSLKVVGRCYLSFSLSASSRFQIKYQDQSEWQIEWQNCACVRYLAASWCLR